MALAKPKANVEAKAKSKATKAADETVVSEQNSQVVETEDNTVADKAEVETQSTQAASSQVAVRQETQAVATSGNRAIQTGSLEQELIANGFEGLEAGYHSFVSIKLPSDGIFCTSEEEQIGKSILVKLLGSKQKYVYNRSDDDDAVLFSYDRVHTTTGESLDDALEEWKAEGATVTEKKYADVQAEVVDGDEIDEDMIGEIVILSVSPSSTQKLFGHMGKLNRKGLDPRITVTEVYVADKVKTKGGQQFYPWGFRISA